MKFVWVAMICSIFVAGCTAVTPITPSVTEKFEPPSDLVIERELGDWLVRYQYAVTKPSYKIVGNLDPDPLNQFKVGTILEPLREDETFQYFRSPWKTVIGLFGVFTWMTSQRVEQSQGHGNSLFVQTVVPRVVLVA